MEIRTLAAADARADPDVRRQIQAELGGALELFCQEDKYLSWVRSGDVDEVTDEQVGNAVVGEVT